jgi:starch phosphorylase
MRESMARLTPRFSANRTVREYCEQLYLPAAAAYGERAANNGAVGRQVLDWQHALEKHWGGLRFGELKVETKGGKHLFEVQVFLNGLDTAAVRVELYGDDAAREGAAERQKMNLIRQHAGGAGSCTYGAVVSATRPSADYTVRVIPEREGVAVPLEEGRILWQR